MVDVLVFSDTSALAHEAAERTVTLCSEAIADHGRFSVALSGGSTPRTLFELLAREPYASRIEWEHVHIFWGDERCVPPDHVDSNYRMARETLLDHVPLPSENVRRIKAERDPAQAAEEYEHVVRMFFAASAAPRFDLVLLGMGDDGHTASLFPSTQALQVTSHWVAANYVPKLDAWRVTLTAPAINAGVHVMFLVTGASKAEALYSVLHGPHQPEEYPSQLIAPREGTLLWLVDQAAAARL